MRRLGVESAHCAGRSVVFFFGTLSNLSRSPSKAGTDEDGKGVGSDNNDVDGIVMVDASRQGWWKWRWIEGREEGRETSRSMGQRGAERTKGWHE